MQERGQRVRRGFQGREGRAEVSVLHLTPVRLLQRPLWKGASPDLTRCGAHPSPNLPRTRPLSVARDVRIRSALHQVAVSKNAQRGRPLHKQGDYLSHPGSRSASAKALCATNDIFRSSNQTLRG